MDVIPITALWLPLLVGSVLVFVVSSLIHMLLPYHRSDFSRIPDEDAVLDALGAIDIPPGDYVLPHGGGPEAMKDPSFLAKIEKGPNAIITVVSPDTMRSMGPQLVQWFAFILLVGVLSAYLGGRMLGAGAEYLDVFRVTGTVAFASFSMALMQGSIWFRRRWSTTLKSMFDGLVYAALIGGTFGWLWPV